MLCFFILFRTVICDIMYPSWYDVIYQSSGGNTCKPAGNACKNLTGPSVPSSSPLITHRTPSSLGLKFDFLSWGSGYTMSFLCFWKYSYFFYSHLNCWEWSLPKLGLIISTILYLLVVIPCCWGRKMFGNVNPKVVACTDYSVYQRW